MNHPSPQPLGATLHAHAADIDAPDPGLAERAIAGGRRRRRRAVAAGLASTTAGVLLVVGVAVGTHHLGAFPNHQLPAQTQTDVTEPPQETPSPGPTDGPTMTTTVYLSSEADPAQAGCGTVHPVERTVPKTTGVTRAALTELLKGATPQEHQQGYGSGFSAATAGALRTVTVKDGTAYVDLVDLRSVIPNASTSCGSAAFLAQLVETTKAAAKVENVRLAIDGQPAILWGWLQRGCDEANDRCDPTPFGTLRYADLPTGAPVHPPYHMEPTGTGAARHYTYVDERGRVDLPVEAGPAYVERRAGDTVVLMANGWRFTGDGTNDNRQIYVIGADRRPRLVVRGNIGAVSPSTDGRYVAYVTASGAPDLRDMYDALVVRDVATGTIVANVPVHGRYALTWDGHVVVATPTDPRGAAAAWDVDRAATGDPGLGVGAVAPEVISLDGTRGVRELPMPWPTPRPGEVQQAPRTVTESVTFAGNRSVHLRAPLTAGRLLVYGGPTWEDATHVILQDIGTDGAGVSLVRCDVTTGACEQAPDPQGRYSAR